MTRSGVFMVWVGQFAPLECSEFTLEATGWHGRWLDLRACQRQEKP